MYGPMTQAELDQLQARRAEREREEQQEIVGGATALACGLLLCTVLIPLALGSPWL